MKNIFSLLALIIMLAGVSGVAQKTTPVDLPSKVAMIKKFAVGYGAVAKDDFRKVNMRAYISKDRIIILNSRRQNEKTYEIIEIESYQDGIDTVYTGLFINLTSFQKKKIRVHLAFGDHMIVVYFNDAEYYFKF